MTEYIKREDALRHRRKMSGADFGGEFWDLAVLCEDIERIPASDVEEVRHGEWVLTKMERGWNCMEYPAEYTCSLCGRTESQQEPYCHCGAKMDGVK